MKPSDFEKLLAAFSADSAEEDALIAEMDRRYEESERSGILPDSSVAFRRFMKRTVVRDSPNAPWQFLPKGDATGVLFRRYMMASGQRTDDIVRRFSLSEALVMEMFEAHDPFDPDQVDDHANVLTNWFGDPLPSVMLLLKELAAHHFARVSKTPVLLAARRRSPT